MIYCIKPQYLQNQEFLIIFPQFALYLVFLYYFCQRQAALGNRNEGTAYIGTHILRVR